MSIIAPDVSDGVRDIEDETLLLLLRDQSFFAPISIDGNIHSKSFSRLNSSSSNSMRKLSSLRLLSSFKVSLKRALSSRNTNEALSVEEEADSIEACIDAVLPSNSTVEASIREWLDGQGLMKGLDYEVNLISGGYVNWAFHIAPVGASSSASAEGILVKYVKPGAKLVPGLSLDVVRIFTEAHGLKVGSGAAPDLVPRWIGHHATPTGDGMVALAFLPGRSMLTEVIFEKGLIIPGLGGKVGAGLAKIAVGSSLAYLGREAFDEQRALLKASDSVSSWMLDHISSQIFHSEMKSGDCGCSWPDNDDDMIRSSIFESEKLLGAVKSLRALMTADEATCDESQLSLVHLDVWLNNLLVSESDDVSLIDFEFSRLGSAALDIGMWIQQLLSAAITTKALANQEGDVKGKPAKQQRLNQFSWLLSSAKEAWAAFEAAFEAARADIPNTSLPLPMCPPISDVLGFCGMISLVRGGLSNCSTVKINLGGTGNPHCDIATRCQVKVGVKMLNERQYVTLDEIITTIE
jgi:5-methylthioribose kinase